jgi:hypothetical protein
MQPTVLTQLNTWAQQIAPQHNTLASWQAIAAQYPWCSLAHLFTARHQQQTNPNNHLEALQTATLHIGNPFWVKRFATEDIDTLFPVANQNNATVHLTVNEAPLATIFEEDASATDIDDTDAPPENEEDASVEAEPISKLGSMLSEQAALFKQAVPADATLPILSEPYHSIDYFASQGIKLDKAAPEKVVVLANRVQTFTEWLKQMKRHNANPTDLGTSPENEALVSNMATASNTIGDVVTEAMAQVLAKQGLKSSAIGIYKKLILLHPDKSAYFANQINLLNKQ